MPARLPAHSSLVTTLEANSCQQRRLHITYRGTHIFIGQIASRTSCRALTRARRCNKFRTKIVFVCSRALTMGSCDAYMIETMRDLIAMKLLGSVSCGHTVHIQALEKAYTFCHRAAQCGNFSIRSKSRVSISQPGFARRSLCLQRASSFSAGKLIYTATPLATLLGRRTLL